MMFPNISYSKSNNSESSTSSIANVHMLSNYQNSLSYLSQQIQLNNNTNTNSSLFTSNKPVTSTTFTGIHLHKSSPTSNSKREQQRDVTSFSSSSSSASSSCSSTSSSLLPPIFNIQFNNQYQNHNYFNTSQQSTSSIQSQNILLDSFKSLNPATLSMANDYLNNYLLNFNNHQNQSMFPHYQDKSYMHLDKVRYICIGL